MCIRAHICMCVCARARARACMHVKVGDRGIKASGQEVRGKRGSETTQYHRISSADTVTLVLYSPLNLVVWAPGPGDISSKEKANPWATEASRKVLNRMLKMGKAIKQGSRECSSI